MGLLIRQVITFVFASFFVLNTASAQTSRFKSELELLRNKNVSPAKLNPQDEEDLNQLLNQTSGEEVLSDQISLGQSAIQRESAKNKKSPYLTEEDLRPKLYKKPRFRSR